MSKTTIDLPISKDEHKRWVAQKLESYFFPADEPWTFPWIKQQRYEIICEIMSNFYRLEFATIDGVEYWIGEPTPGSDIGKAASAAYHLSSFSGVRVTFKCNGTAFIIHEEAKA